MPAPFTRRAGIQRMIVTPPSPLIPETQRADNRYRAAIYPSIRDVSCDEWNSLRDPLRDPLMDPRFILAVESSMASLGRVRQVLIRDESGAPAAAASLCSFDINASVLAEGSSRRVAEVIGRFAPRLLRLRILLCGLPVSTGSSHLRLAAGA